MARALTVCILTGKHHHEHFSLFGLREFSVLFELTLGHQRSH